MITAGLIESVRKSTKKDGRIHVTIKTAAADKARTVKLDLAGPHSRVSPSSGENAVAMLLLPVATGQWPSEAAIPASAPDGVYAVIPGKKGKKATVLALPASCVDSLLS